MKVRNALVAEQSKQNGRYDQGKGMERDGEKKQNEGTTDYQDAQRHMETEKLGTVLLKLLAL